MVSHHADIAKEYDRLFVDANFEVGYGVAVYKTP